MRFATKSGTWELTDDQIATWQETFEPVDVDREGRIARAWCEANPGKRKTARGMPRFLFAWLSRAARDAKAQQGKPRPGQPPRYTAWECPHDPPCTSRYQCGTVGDLKPVKAAS